MSPKRQRGKGLPSLALRAYGVLSDSAKSLSGAGRGRPAVLQQTQIDQFLLELILGWLAERVHDFIEQQIGELLSGPASG